MSQGARAIQIAGDPIEFDFPEAYWLLAERDYGEGQKEATLHLHTASMEQEHSNARREDMSEEERMRRDHANRKRSMRRSKKRVRQAAMAGGLKYLWTLTFAENWQDEPTAWHEWKLFLKRLWNRAPGYSRMKYVVVAERQKRGAIHFHFATNRWLPQPLIEDCWGKGYVFVRGPREGYSEQKCAQYVTKYIAKEFEHRGAFTNCYRRSLGIEIPEPELHAFLSRDEALAFFQRDGKMTYLWSGDGGMIAWMCMWPGDPPYTPP